MNKFYILFSFSPELFCSRCMKTSAIAAVLFFSINSIAICQQSIQGVPWTGDYGVTVTVNEMMAMQDSIGTFSYKIPREHEVHLRKKKNPEAPKISSFPENDISQQKGGGGNSVAATQAIGANFLTATLPGSGYIPPDCNGDAGPTQILAIANGQIQVYNKAGVLGALNVTTNVFFNSVRNGSTVSDPHIRYDRLTQRWFVIAINVASTNNRVMIAVSSGPTITGTGTFTFFYFQHNVPPPAGDNGKFLDYPTLGLDVNALYLGGVRFTATFDGCPVFVIQKASVLGAGPIVVTAFRNAGSTGSGIFVPQGVQNDDPLATEGYFVGVDAGVYSLLNFIRVNNPGGAPSITNLTALTVPATSNPQRQVHAGAAANRRLDGLDDRLFAAHVMKNKITGVTTLWSAHTALVNSSGVASGTMNRNAVRWYQIGNMTTAAPTLIQSGTIYDNAGSNYRGFWNGSVAMSGQGHAGSGFSTASVVNYADAAVAGRYSSDVAGTMQPFAFATASSTAYNVQNVDGQRWGDYSQVVIDPNDNMTMWTFQEYCNATNSWGLRVIQLIAPAPPPPPSLNPLPTVGQLSSVAVSVIASSTPNNTGFFDPGNDAGGPGYANRISASASGGIIVNSITFISPTQVNFNLNTSGVPPGTYVITITNPDGQFTTINITVIASPLPVELVFFSAHAIENAVVLEWSTASESGTKVFEIEKSAGTLNEFVFTGSVQAAGNSVSLSEYRFTDLNPVYGVSYYRLKQVDFSGRFFYTKVIPVKFGKESFGISSVTPDKSNNLIHVLFYDDDDSEVVIELFNLFGETVRSSSFKPEKGLNDFYIPANNLSGGIYFLTISDGASVLKRKIFY